MGRLITIFLLIATIWGCQSSQSEFQSSDQYNFSKFKINGVSFTSPPQPITSNWTTQIKRINADWVALMPFGFCQQKSSTIIYNNEQQWWGEKKDGITTLISHAKGAGHKIMIKPQIWIPNSWPGDFTPPNQKEFEASYSSYIITFAKLADSLNVDLFCIGTEFKLNTAQHPQFWNTLIDSIKVHFKGQLTYAANWDNYQNITFWNKLDYIGVDAYFPLSKANNPTEKTLLELWQPIVSQLKATSVEYKKPILFTEYGYRNINKTTWNQWENDDDYSFKTNNKAQITAYTALFKSIWNKNWFSGGFLWKWYEYDHKINSETNNDYTPQNKPVEAVIKKTYGTN